MDSGRDGRDIRDIKGYAQLEEGQQGARRRTGEGVTHEDDDGVYDELERLRGIVDVMEGDRNKGCLKLSLNNSAMSTIFGLVFVVIITVTVYAFYNLYRALSKRFFPLD